MRCFPLPISQFLIEWSKVCSIFQVIRAISNIRMSLLFDLAIVAAKKR